MTRAYRPSESPGDACGRSTVAIGLSLGPLVSHRPSATPVHFTRFLHACPHLIRPGARPGSERDATGAVRRDVRPDPPGAPDPGRAVPRGVRAGPGLVRGGRLAAAQAGRADAGRRTGWRWRGSPIAGHPAFEVSEIEAKRPGPHYSVETLAEVHRERPDDDLFFLIGADSLADLPSWREPDGSPRLATIVVVNRPGIDVDPTDPAARLRPRHAADPVGDDPPDRHRLPRPPPPPRRGPEHPLPGPPRGRGVHRRPRSCTARGDRYFAGRLPPARRGHRWRAGPWVRERAGSGGAAGRFGGTSESGGGSGAGRHGGGEGAGRVAQTRSRARSRLPCAGRSRRGASNRRSPR